MSRRDRGWFEGALPDRHLGVIAREGGRSRTSPLSGLRSTSGAFCITADLKAKYERSKWVFTGRGDLPEIGPRG